MGELPLPDGTPTETDTVTLALVRRVVTVTGTVQGIGFRPTVAKLAFEWGVAGWVLNGGGAAEIVCEGSAGVVNGFLDAVRGHLPIGAHILSWDEADEQPLGITGFSVRASSMMGDGLGVVPDRRPCQTCLNEMADSQDRRFRYPFINCTDCGPRWTIVMDLPYDRERTSMRDFPLCAQCAAEYGDPQGRRFHAEPIACPRCGPHVAYLDDDGGEIAQYETALDLAQAALMDGKIVAFKGVGGFQCLCRADNDATVRRLRIRKGRPDKPFAVMIRDVAQVEHHCHLTEKERRILEAPEAPIVLLKRRHNTTITWRVAPRLRQIGVMLPSSPLHYLLLENLPFPVVATSGNLSGEPLCITNDEAVNKLRGIVDGFLVHNRAVIRPVDDSVVHVVSRRVRVLRRARGFSPTTLPVSNPYNRCGLGLGGHLKNTVALLKKSTIVVSQHIGDLDSVASTLLHRQQASDLVRLARTTPQFVATDWHPDYRTTVDAPRWECSIAAVQHHHAHVVAAITELGISTPVLGVAWDGLGLGTDNELWGGEWLLVSGNIANRFAYLRPLMLPGGEHAHNEPWRCAAAVLMDLFGDRWLEVAVAIPGLRPVQHRLKLLDSVMRHHPSPPKTTAAGRLFDAASALLGRAVCKQSWEGQTGAELEALADTVVFHWPKRSGASNGWVSTGAHNIRLPSCKSAKPYQNNPHDSAPQEVDWRPILRRVIRGILAGIRAPLLAASFHRDLARLIATVSLQSGHRNIVLVGGCFQNRLLAGWTVQELKLLRLKPWLPRMFPVGDGALSVGQVMVAAQRYDSETGS